MKSRICDKLRYREKPLLEIAEDKMMSLLYSEEDAAKIAALDLTFEDFMTVISESIRAVIGQSGNDGKN